MLAVVAGTALLNAWMVAAESGRVFERLADVPARPVGLVLGTTPGSVEMADRLDAAAALYQAGKVQRLLVSGGGEPTVDEADAMRAGLIKRGVPAAAILRDHAGFRTLDSMARAREVFGENGVVVVSQGFHLTRAVFLGRHWGLDAVGYAAADPGGFISRDHAREWLARVLAVLDVEVLKRQPRVSGPPEPAGS